jgi:hypothetical protein
MKMPENNQNEQLDLGVKITKLENWYNFVNKVNETERRFAIMPFWRDGTSVYAFMSVIFSIMVSLVTSIVWSQSLSGQIPLFYSYNLSNWQLYNQLALFLFSVVVWGIQFSVLYLSYQVYPVDRRLAFVSNIFLIILSLLFLITIGQLFSLQLL